jgi:hypothetical protein
MITYNQKKHEQCDEYERYHYYKLKEMKLEEFTFSSYVPAS